jgi:hypothetical protein
VKQVKAQKTIRQRIEYRPGVSDWFETTQVLFNQLVAFYFAVIQAHALVLNLPNRQTLTALERLTHATTGHPHPVMPLSDVAGNVPVVFRRAAINAGWAWPAPSTQTSNAGTRAKPGPRPKGVDSTSAPRFLRAPGTAASRTMPD